MYRIFLLLLLFPTFLTPGGTKHIHLKTNKKIKKRHLRFLPGSSSRGDREPEFLETHRGNILRFSTDSGAFYLAFNRSVFYQFEGLDSIHHDTLRIEGLTWIPEFEPDTLIIRTEKFNKKKQTWKVASLKRKIHPKRNLENFQVPPIWVNGRMIEGKLISKTTDWFATYCEPKKLSTRYHVKGNDYFIRYCLASP